MQNMTLLIAVASVAIETNASTKSADSNNGQIALFSSGFTVFSNIFELIS
jgi:hypothetical protein